MSKTKTVETDNQNDDLSSIKEFLATHKPRIPLPPNHEKRDRILQQLSIGPFEQFRLWLAKADIYVLPHTTSQSRSTLGSLGLMVMFTTVLAFCTSLYTITSTMIDVSSTSNFVVALLLATVYAFGIMLIDREIVGAVSHGDKLKEGMSGAARFIFAVMIGITVSFPVELKLFEGRIETEIQRMEEKDNQTFKDQINLIKAPYANASSTNLESLNKNIESTLNEINVLDGEIRREAGVAFCGPKCEHYQELKKSAENKLQGYRSQVSTSASGITLSPIDQEKVKELESKMKKNVGHRDLLTKWKALENITDTEGNRFRTVRLFITMFFMALELIPLFLKKALGTTEYHDYIESRHHINHAKIVTATNVFLDQIRTEKDLTKIPKELSDFIAGLIEDEQGWSVRDSAMTDEQKKDALASASHYGSMSSEQFTYAPEPTQPNQPPPTIDENT